MGMGMIAELEAHSVGGGKQGRRLRVDVFSVAEHGGEGGAVGVTFVVCGVYGKDIFQRTRGGVIKGKGYQFSLRRDKRYVNVRGVPNALGKFKRWLLHFHLVDCWIV